MNIRRLSLAVTLAMGLAHIAQGSTNEFNAVTSGVGSGGTSWLDYTDKANWAYPDRGAGYAQADELGYGHADLAKCASGAACGRYIQLPDELRLQYVMGDRTKDMILNPVLRGDGELTYNFVSTTWTLSNMGALWLYSPYVLEGSSNYAGFNLGRTEICGPLSRTVLSGDAAKTGIDNWSHGPRISTAVAFNYSRYATEQIAATGVREITDWNLDYQLDVNGSATFVSPCGSATDIVRAFELTDKSPFAKPAAGAAEGLLPVGTAVTGTGVDAGTYLKRIFPDGSIELSKPAAATATADLTFAAVTYRTTVVGDSSRLRVQNQKGARTVKVNKSRAEDDFEVRVHDFTHYIAESDPARMTMTLNVGTDEGFLPGRLRIMDMYRKNPSEKAVDPLTIVLENCNLVPPARLDGDNANLTLPGAAHTARITVDTDTVRPATGTYKTFVNAVAGTLVKDGVGTWPVAFTNTVAAYSGKVVVEAGTLQVLNEGATLGVVEIKTGATLVIPVTGASVTQLIVAEGAILSGGLLTAGSVIGDPEKIEYRKGAGLVDPTASTDPLTVELTGGRMMKIYEDGDSIAVVTTNSVLHVNGSGVADILVVGGGGGAGCSTGAGGGGGGGVIYRQQVALRAGYYAVTVGAGGKGGIGRGQEKDAQGIVTNCSFNGENSQFLDFVALGGGAGGGLSGTGTTRRPAPFDTVLVERGTSGGSGGGGGVLYPESGSVRDKTGGAGTDGQGHAGGMSYIRSQSDAAGGGGGGAGAAAADAGKDDAGVYGSAGGDGLLVPIWGNRYWGGGGAGSATANHGATFVSGGKGGGGNARVGKNIANGDDGAPNTGGGGGASSSSGWDGSGLVGQRGGNGGSGVVIIRFTSEQFNVKHEAAIAQGGKLRRRGGHFIHTFLADGTFTLNEGACVDLLVVGGGGGGGKSGGGGGGGGGVAVATNIWVDAGTYAISVGAGGAGHADAIATVGSGSSVDFGGFAGSYSVPGGGRGGWRNWNPPNNAGGSGGGGGAPYGGVSITDASCWKTNFGAVGVSPYGYAGGTSCGWPDPTSPNLSSFKRFACAGGGGGGAAGPGGDGWYVGQPSQANRAQGGAGGAGIWCDFSGSLVEYGGGGAGGSAAASNSASDAVAGADGAAGTGRGGGGASQGVDTTLNGGNGGCGCVIIRYPATDRGMMLIVR